MTTSGGTIAAIRRAAKDVGREAVTPRFIVAMILFGLAFGAFFGSALSVIRVPGYGWIIALALVAVIVVGAIVYLVRYGRAASEQHEAEQQLAGLLWQFGSREPSPIPSERMTELRELSAEQRPKLLGLAVGQALAGGASTAMAITVYLAGGDSHFGIGSLVGSAVVFSLVPAARLAHAQRLYERTAPDVDP